MATIAENLLKLNDIKEAQKTELSKMFPYMDWNTVPYSMYSKYYKYRNLLDTCGELAVNAYNKTNSDIDKDILYDYCCKRYDEGYLVDFTTLQFPAECIVTNNKVTIPATFKESSVFGGSELYSSRLSFKLKISGLLPEDTIIIATGSRGKDVEITNNNKEVNFFFSDISFNNKGKSQEYTFIINIVRPDPNHEVIIEQLPGYTASNDINLSEFKFDSTDGYAPYKNALTKSQISSYGKAASKFALPRDFTLFASRTNYTSIGGYLAVKNDVSNSNKGEFFFEGNNNNIYSYESKTQIAITDKVVSYMTPTSYNGTTIATGDYIGNTESIFYILGTPDIRYNLSGALYSVVLFNRTLTVEEIATVKAVLDFEYLEKIK